MTAWQLSAACAGMDPAPFHSDDAEVRETALKVCARCPVTVACRAAAVAEGERWAVRGGEWFGIPDDPDEFLIVEDKPVAHIRVRIAAVCGSRGKYNAGCRCDECTAANTRWKAEYELNGPVTERPRVPDMNVPMFEGVA